MSLNIETVPASLGTTCCEYSVACTRQTNKLADFPFGQVPICDFHIEWYEKH